MKLLLVYNLKKDNLSIEEAEFDSIETIEYIKEALISKGNSVICLEENDDFFEKARSLKSEIDMVFNIAEGRKGTSRESVVPFILDLLEIPYTASNPKTMMMTIDKNLCNTFLSSNGISCPKSVLMNKDNLDSVKVLNFPVIVKPNFEGSSKGISERSIYTSYNSLVEYFTDGELPENIFISEEYISGREFTIAVLISQKGIVVFKPMEVIFREKTPYNVYSFEIKKTGSKYVYFDYSPSISSHIEEKMKQMTKKVVSILGVRDFARLDFKLSKEDVPYFIEINPLPGLAKDYSDFSNICKANGMIYENMIEKILENAKERVGQ